MSFSNEQRIKATRKRAWCVGCGQPIEVGSAAVRWTGITDGDFQSVAYHPECRDAECALNEMHSADEWIGLCEVTGERDDELWLLEEFPAVAARLKIEAGEDVPSDGGAA